MDVHILTELDVVGGGGAGAPVRLRAVFYMVGKHGPFLLEGPADELTQERIRHELAAESRRVHSLVPHTGP